MVSAVLEAILVLALLTILGYVSGKRGIIDEKLRSGLSELMLRVCLPCIILSSSQMTYTPERTQGMWLTFVFSIAFYVVSILLLRPFSRLMLRKEPDRQNAFVCLCVFANTAFIGLPVVQGVCGAEGVFYACIFNITYNFFMFSYGTYAFSGEGKGIGQMARQVLLDPCIILSFCMVVIFLLQWTIPAPLLSGLDMVGNMCTPISMLVLGALLSRQRLRDLLQDKYAYLVSAIRLVAMPLLVLAIVWALGIRGTVGMALVLMCAMPAGSLNVVMAERYQREADFTTRAVTQGNMLLLLTIPAITALSALVLS